MAGESVKTRIGEIELVSGYPTATSVTKLYDELDFQRAVQAFIWATPAVSLEALRIGNDRDWGSGFGQVAFVDGYTGPEVEGLTANATTIYAASFVDLRAGAVVIESPPGAYGVIDDMWQRPVSEVGPFGPDRGKGGTFLLIPPGAESPEDPDRFVVPSPTNTVLYLVRAIVQDGDISTATGILKQIKVYPLDSADSPPPTTVVSSADRPMKSVPPRDLGYWKMLAGVIDREVVEERDRFFHAMLKPLGIEKGAPFDPDERQQALLEDAAQLGFLMAQTISLEPRFEGVSGYPGTRWEWVLNLNPDQEAEHYSQLDERTDYTFEAITVAAGMVQPIVGAGSQYMSTAKDGSGAWLEGGNTYLLRVPAGVPVEDFWSVTVYDNLTRSMVNTPSQRPGASSADALVVNEDGSIDLHFGPDPSDDPNHIQTVADRGWFAYFRWYGPTQAFFDKIWTLPDIQRA